MCGVARHSFFVFENKSIKLMKCQNFLSIAPNTSCHRIHKKMGSTNTHTHTHASAHTQLKVCVGRVGRKERRFCRFRYTFSLKVYCPTRMWAKKIFLCLIRLSRVALKTLMQTKKSLQMFIKHFRFGVKNLQQRQRSFTHEWFRTHFKP